MNAIARAKGAPMTPVKSETTCHWTISGMDCGACASKIRDAVGRLPGVGDVKVNTLSERLLLTLDETQTGRETVENLVRTLGYGIAPRTVAEKGPCMANTDAIAGESHDDSRNTLKITDDGSNAGHARDAAQTRGKGWYQTAKGHRVIITAILLGVAWAVERLAPEPGKGAFVVAGLIGLAPIARGAFIALRLGQPFTVESLMTVSTVGALFIGAAEEAALLVFLFTAGEVLEDIAATKARDGIRAMASLAPETALLDVDGATREVPAASLAIGQTVLVRPGDRIPVDGEITEGISGVDDSPITGESTPITKGPGDAVFAGSINTDTALRVAVTKAAEDSTISRIVRLVEDAEEARAPTERFIDRFSRWYMPAIIVVAALVVLVPPLAFDQPWETWIYRGLALLLIGCPCALVISTPASVASALSLAARRGLLMKGGAVIEAAARVRQIAFDKTGTLTHGRPVVIDVLALGKATEADILAVAAGVETGSSHPLAVAIVNKAKQAGIEALPSKDAQALVGKGVMAKVDGASAWVSSPRHAFETGGLDEFGLRRATGFEDEGHTVVAVFRDKAPLGLIAMRDAPRADARDAVADLKRLGVGPIILTGDSPRAAAAIADGLGMEFHADMMPEDKLRTIRDMGEHGGVMMVGDGINDAPALKQASVGVAMGSGTDVALETADAAILRDRITDIPAMIRLARGTMANIRQNVAIALGLKAVFLITSVAGLTGLWLAIMADTGTTVLVTLNALRLLQFDLDRDP